MIASPKTIFHFSCAITFSIRIVADCVPLPCQITRKLKRAKALKFTTIPDSIFIHCCG